MSPRKVGIKPQFDRAKPFILRSIAKYDHRIILVRTLFLTTTRRSFTPVRRQRQKRDYGVRNGQRNLAEKILDRFEVSATIIFAGKNRGYFTEPALSPTIITL